MKQTSAVFPSQLFTSKVSRGEQLGRTIDFPTLNLDASLLPTETTQGVYAASVKIKGKSYLGALYYGPRLVLNETSTVLEIFVLDFSQEIYGQTVQFSLLSFVRRILDFDSFAEMQQQLVRDVQAIRDTHSRENLV